MADHHLRHTAQQLLDGILSQMQAPVLDGSLANELGDIVSGTSLEAPSAEALLERYCDRGVSRLLDFGCGGCHHRGFLEDIGYKWQGTDYIEAVADNVRAEVFRQEDVAFYDGETLPFDNNSFDVVASLFVSNCLRSPKQSYLELCRVLKPGGLIIGQTGSLEIMMDYISFNASPYGLKILAEDAGMDLVKIVPKHDVFSFTMRHLLITMTRSNDSPFNEMLDPTGFFFSQLEKHALARNVSIRDINLLKIQFSAHLCFVMQKPGSEARVKGLDA